MDVGRELDAMIAEKVMGWRWFAFKVEGVVNTCYARYLAEHEMRERDRPWRGGANVIDCVDATSDVPKFSTDIAAAWSVVEKMRERGFDFTLRHFGIYTMTFVWEMGEKRESADSDSAPHAICLAALAALSTPSELLTHER